LWKLAEILDLYKLNFAIRQKMELGLVWDFLAATDP
jgi:hypothetical protein